MNGNNINLTLNVYFKLIKEIEKWEIFDVKMKNCEYMLSKRDLYSKIGGSYKELSNGYSFHDLIQWVLYLSNGKRTIDQISSILGTTKKRIKFVSLLLSKKNLLRQI